MGNQHATGDHQSQDLLLTRAEELVQSAEIHAVGIFSALLERFPFLNQVDVEHWDFVLTVAGVFIASTRLNNLRLGGSREEMLMGVIAARLNRWNAGGVPSFEDCKALFESEFDRLAAAGHESRFVATDALGMWIVWNVLGHPPRTNDECMLVRATGTLVTHAFFNWWSVQQP